MIDIKDMNFLQSNNWKKTKEALGNKCYGVGEYFFQTTKLPYLNKSIGYMPRVDLNKVDFTELINQAKKASCVFVTIDPDNLATELNSLEFIKRKGLNVDYGLPIHLPKTSIIDLSLDENTLLSNMKQKTRYNLKLAQKKGLNVVVSKEDSELETFINLYLETVKRQNYSGRSSKYLREVWNQFKDNVFITTAYFEDKPLVSWFVIAYDNTLTYVYGGSSEEYKNLMAPYLVVWELIKYGKENGYIQLDLFGIKDNLSDGYSRFKTGFGGNTVEYAATVDIIIESNLYRFIKLLYKIRNKIRF